MIVPTSVLYPLILALDWKKFRQKCRFRSIFIGVGGLGTTLPDLVYDMSINCTSFHMQVNFALKSSYLNVETFHFDNKSCGSYAANSTHVSLRTPLDACGTTSRQSEDSVTYFNKVVAETKDKNKGYVVEFPFSCAYNRRETIGTPSFQPRKKVTVFEGKMIFFGLLVGHSFSSVEASLISIQCHIKAR